MVSEKELCMLIKDWVLTHRTGGDTLTVDETVDLIASGALDSVGFIELLSYIEPLTGQKIDVQEFDSNAFTSIEGLVHNIYRANTHI
jgi:acyl carrier protein